MASPLDGGDSIQPALMLAYVTSACDDVPWEDQLLPIPNVAHTAHTSTRLNLVRRAHQDWTRRSLRFPPRTVVRRWSYIAPQRTPAALPLWSAVRRLIPRPHPTKPRVDRFQILPPSAPIGAFSLCPPLDTPSPQNLVDGSTTATVSTRVAFTHSRAAIAFTTPIARGTHATIISSQQPHVLNEQQRKGQISPSLAHNDIFNNPVSKKYIQLLNKFLPYSNCNRNGQLLFKKGPRQINDSSAFLPGKDQDHVCITTLLICSQNQPFWFRRGSISGCGDQNLPASFGITTSIPRARLVLLSFFVMWRKHVLSFLFDHWNKQYNIMGWSWTHIDSFGMMYILWISWTAADRNWIGFVTTLQPCVKTRSPTRNPRHNKSPLNSQVRQWTMQFNHNGNFDTQPCTMSKIRDKSFYSTISLLSLLQNTLECLALIIVAPSVLIHQKRNCMYWWCCLCCIPPKKIPNQINPRNIYEETLWA